MYVIAGASGNTGKVAAETLLSQKQPVRVIVRSAAKGEEWKKRGAEIAITELDDVEALTNALRGAKGVYLLLPPRPESSDSRGENEKRTQTFVKAIEASGVSHVVFLSSIGAQHPNGTGPIGSLHDAEKALRGVKADVTFVRAAYFMENWGASLYALGQNALPTFLAAKNRISMIASADIGTTVANALREGGHGKSVIELAGPVDYTPEEVAETLGRVTNKSIALQVGPTDVMIGALTGAGLNEHWAGLYQEMTVGLNNGHVVWEGNGARAVRGATSIDTVLKKLVAT